MIIWQAWFARVPYTVQKMKFSIKDFFSKYNQIRRKLRIWSHLLKKSLIENFNFCALKDELFWISFERFFCNSKTLFFLYNLVGFLKVYTCKLLLLFNTVYLMSKLLYFGNCRLMYLIKTSLLGFFCYSC